MARISSGGEESTSQSSISVAPKPKFVYQFKHMDRMPKITTKCYPHETITKLRGILDEYDVHYFEKESQFKHLFHFQGDSTLTKVQMSILLNHSVIVRDKKELWFVLNGVPIRYSIVEHALISGLNCGPYPKGWESKRGDTFRRKYFGRGKVTPVQIIGKLVKAKNDEDRKRLATLLLLAQVIAHKPSSDNSISHDLIDMVDDLEFCEGFPWGRYTFEKIVDTCRKHVSGESPKPKWYCGGFMIPIMLLPFETIPSLGGKRWYVDVENADPSCPRMCKKMVKPGINLKYAEAIRLIGDSKDIRSILCPDYEENFLHYDLDNYEGCDPDVQIWMEHIRRNPKGLCWEDIREQELLTRKAVLGDEKKGKGKGKGTKRKKSVGEKMIELEDDEAYAEPDAEGDEERDGDAEAEREGEDEDEAEGKEDAVRLTLEQKLVKEIKKSEKRIINAVRELLRDAGFHLPNTKAEAANPKGAEKAKSKSAEIDASTANQSSGSVRDNEFLQRSYPVPNEEPVGSEEDLANLSILIKNIASAATIPLTEYISREVTAVVAPDE